MYFQLRPEHNHWHLLFQVTFTLFSMMRNHNRHYLLHKLHIIHWQSHQHNINWRYVSIGILFPKFNDSVVQMIAFRVFMIAHSVIPQKYRHVRNSYADVCVCVCVLLYSVFIIYVCYVRKVLVRLWAIITVHFSSPCYWSVLCPFKQTVRKPDFKFGIKIILLVAVWFQVYHFVDYESYVTYHMLALEWCSVSTDRTERKNKTKGHSARILFLYCTL